MYFFFVADLNRSPFFFSKKWSLRFTRRSVYLYSYIQPYIHLCDTFTNEKVQKFQRIHFLVENRINVNDVLACYTGQIIIFYTSWVLFNILHLRIEVLIFPCCWMIEFKCKACGVKIFRNASFVLYSHALPRCIELLCPYFWHPHKRPTTVCDADMQDCVCSSSHVMWVKYHSQITGTHCAVMPGVIKSTVSDVREAAGFLN